jgi:hypothetical protein
MFLALGALLVELVRERGLGWKRRAQKVQLIAMNVSFLGTLLARRVERPGRERQRLGRPDADVDARVALSARLDERVRPGSTALTLPGPSRRASSTVSPGATTDIKHPHVPLDLGSICERDGAEYRPMNRS